MILAVETCLEFGGLCLEVCGYLLVAHILLAELDNELPRSDKFPFHDVGVVHVGIFNRLCGSRPAGGMSKV
jgi:hypothetical protein